MSEVTREEFNALEQRVAKLEGPPVVDGHPLYLKLTPGPAAGQITAEWATNPSKEVRLVVSARSGVDAWGGSPDWGTTEDPSARKRVFANLKNDTEYTIRVGVEYTDGKEEQASQTARTLKPTDPGPGTGSSGIVIIGHSKQPYNHIVFSGGDMPIQSLQRNEAEVQTVFDGTMAFITRDSWKSMKSDGIAAAARSLLAAGKMYVLRTPHAPSADGMNKTGAENKYRDEQLKWGEWAVTNGLNNERMVVSLNWEFNGNWYKWSAQFGGNAALEHAMANFIDNVRSAGLDRVKFDLCANVKSQAVYSDWKSVWPGQGYFNTISIDQYDSWPATRNRETWEAKMREPLSIRSGIALAKQWGIQFNLAECGNWHGAPGGGDNPFYWDMVFEELDRGKPNIGWLTGYNHEGAPASLRHDWRTNPKSLQRYRELLRARRTS
jgi:hypothetical protein